MMETVSRGDQSHYATITDITNLSHPMLIAMDIANIPILIVFNCFYSEESRDLHFEYCTSNPATSVVIPKRGSILEFKGVHRQVRLLWMITLNTETIQPRSRRYILRNITKETEHIISGYGCHTHYDYGLPKTQVYRGNGCMDHLVYYLKGEAANIPRRKMTPLTPEQVHSYGTSATCHICNSEITDSGPKVRDHCHYSGSIEAQLIDLVI